MNASLRPLMLSDVDLAIKSGVIEGGNLVLEFMHPVSISELRSKYFLKFGKTVNAEDVNYYWCEPLNCLDVYFNDGSEVLKITDLPRGTCAVADKCTIALPINPETGECGYLYQLYGDKTYGQRMILK